MPFYKYKFRPCQVGEEGKAQSLPCDRGLRQVIGPHRRCVQWRISVSN